MKNVQFRFELRPVKDIEPWGNVGSRKLHWFGLTDGWQCIETAVGRLLEYATPVPPSGETWIDYQAVRLFEDLLGAWPAIVEPVPEHVASRFFGWYSPEEDNRVWREEDDATQDAWEEACSWWRERRVQFDHLRWKPELHFWRIGSKVHLAWDAPGEKETGPVWTVPRVRLTLPLEEMRAAVGDFYQGLLRAMAQRVAEIEHNGWTRTDCTLDVVQLAAEQRRRETWSTAILDQTRTTDWALVRRRLDELGAGQH